MDDDQRPSDTTVPRVVALADMLFSSRIRGTAQVVGVPVHIARSARAVHEAAAAGARLVLLDLDNRAADPPALIRELRETHGDTVRIIAFVSHVHAAAIVAAREAGADQVLARSAFVRDLPAILGAA